MRGTKLVHLDSLLDSLLSCKLPIHMDSVTIITVE